MATITDIIGTLQNLTGAKINQSDIARALNITRATVSTRIKTQSRVNFEEIKKLENVYNVDLSKTGQFDNAQQTITADYYPEVFGSCGTGHFVPSETKEQIQVPVKNFLKRISTQKKYSVINAKGDSMQPFIYNNDKLLVEHWGGEQIIDNQVYVFSYDNEIFIKRLTKNINQLIIKSDNKEYDVIKLTGEDLNKVIIIGQIVGLMREIR